MHASKMIIKSSLNYPHKFTQKTDFVMVSVHEHITTINPIKTDHVCPRKPPSKSKCYSQHLYIKIIYWYTASDTIFQNNN